MYLLERRPLCVYHRLLDSCNLSGRADLKCQTVSASCDDPGTRVIAGWSAREKRLESCDNGRVELTLDRLCKP